MKPLNRVPWIAVGALLLASGCEGSSSFLSSGRAGNSSGGGASVSWVQFQDPREKGFTMDVPQGWTVKGGLFRLGYSGVRMMVDMQSPDGKTDVRIGDVAVPVYSLPAAPYHLKEGGVVDLGAQAQMIVAKYRTGPQYAVLYAQARFGNICKNPQPDQADAQTATPNSLPSELQPQQSSSGRIVVKCQASGGPAVAFAYAQTSLYSGLWMVTALDSYIASPDEASTAWTVLLHCANSIQINPQWTAYQKQMEAEGLQYQVARQKQRMAALGQQVQQFEAQMRAMQEQVAGFEARQGAEAAQVQGFDNALNGITPTYNPITGEEQDVWTGPGNGYWVNGEGQVVNGNAPPPGGGWQQLQPGQ